MRIYYSGVFARRLEQVPMISTGKLLPITVCIERSHVYSVCHVTGLPKK